MGKVSARPIHSSRFPERLTHAVSEHDPETTAADRRSGGTVWRHDAKRWVTDGLRWLLSTVAIGIAVCLAIMAAVNLLLL
jgi:hypothetical protein